MRDIQNMIEFLDENNFIFLNLIYTDIFGGMHNLTIPVDELDPAELAHGIPFDGSSVPGFGKLGKGDMALLPQPDTLFTDEVCDDDGIAGVFCSIVDASDGSSVSTDPRTILAKAEQLIRSELGAQSYWLPELEFFLFDSVMCAYNDYGAVHRFSFDNLAELEITNSSYISSGSEYHKQIASDEGYRFRNELVEYLQVAGLSVRYHHHEVGIGQNEVELLPLPPVRAADGVVLTKYFARMTAKENGLVAVFLPKPLDNIPGSGLHFHQIFLKQGKSLFWDEHSKYAHLSDIALNYIAGLLMHAPALTALTNPSTNSFHRLVDGFEAPTKLFFGLANRSAAVRIPKYVDTPQKKRIEYRPPDATANPYLAIAGMMLAGLDGIRKKINPTEMGFGPFDDDINKWDIKKRGELKSLPRKLSEAAKALLDDNKFLTGDKIFPKKLITMYSNELISDERELTSRLTPYEVAKYIDR